MTEADSKQVVVGVDGSEEATRALKWAAEEAHLRGATLHVVHAWDAPWNYGYVVPDGEMQKLVHDEEQASKRVLADDVAESCSRFPDLKVEIEDVNELPARVLIERSKDADLLVVGSRGRGGFSGLLLGSVSQQLVHHAQCPVVVLPHTAHQK